VLREAWPGLGEVVNSQELESDNEGSAAPSALVEEDVEKLLAQLMPAIKVSKAMCFVGLINATNRINENIINATIVLPGNAFLRFH
jgi:hypothetical protein